MVAQSEEALRDPSGSDSDDSSEVLGPRDDAAPVGALVGIGRTSARWLEQLGIHTRGDLAGIGPIEAYRRVEAAGHKPTLNLLYALEGALRGLHWSFIDPGERETLKAQVVESTSDSTGASP